MASCCDVRTTVKGRRRSVTTMFMYFYCMLHVSALWTAIAGQLKIHKNCKYKPLD